MLELDHIVFAGKDIGKASATYGDKFKVKIIKGGEHEEWGTYNYLAHLLNDCYVEWLGVRDLTIVEQSTNPLIQHLSYLLKHDVQGPFQFALRTTKMDKYVEHFQKNDIPFAGPFPSSRTQPDGSELTWRMLFPTYDHTRESLPFLIEWDQPLKERVDASLVNPKTVTRIDCGGISKQRFMSLYDISPKKRLINRSFLKNAKLNFTNSGILTFDIV